MLKSTRIAAALVLALALSACGSNPTTPAKTATTKKSTASTTAPAPVAPATGTTGPAKAPAAPANPAATGAVSIMLSSLKAEGVAGVAVQLTGPGLEEPIGKTLTAEELETSNTLAFENIPVGKLKAEVAAFDAAEESLGSTTTDVAVVADEEAKVAIQLSAPATAGQPVAFKFVSPEAFDAAPATTSPSTEPSTEPVADDEEDEEDDAPAADDEAIGSKALEVEIIDMQTIRKFLLFKKLEVTVRVTNTNATKTLNGEVKVDFHKLKGFLTKEDVIVETLTAPVTGLAAGKSIDITLTSTKAAEDAEATVHTVVSSSSASSFE